MNKSFKMNLSISFEDLQKGSRKDDPRANDPDKLTINRDLSIMTLGSEEIPLPLTFKSSFGGASTSVPAVELLREYDECEYLKNGVFLSSQKAPPLFLSVGDNPFIKHFLKEKSRLGGLDFLHTLSAVLKVIGLTDPPVRNLKTQVKTELTESSLTETWQTVIEGIYTLHKAGYEKSLDAFPQNYDGSVHDDGTNHIIAAKLKAGVLQVRFPKVAH